MLYKCYFCNFTSTKKYNLDRHLETKTHIEAFKKINKYSCPYCDKMYSTSSNLSKHKKTCEKIFIDQKNNDIDVLKNENYYLKIILEKSEKLEKYMAKEIENDNNHIIKQVSTVAFIKNTYPNAPVLEPLIDMSVLHPNKSKSEFVDEIHDNYKKNKLVSYLGTIVLHQYKKTNPEEQSVWSTDITRLSYLINILNSQNKPLWTKDKKGLYMKSDIISPILDYVRDLICEYIDNNASSTNIKTSSIPQVITTQQKLTDLANIINKIFNTTLHDELNSYLANGLIVLRGTNALK